MRFIDFDFDDDLLDGIEDMGYENATPVQEAVIPHILAGRDVIASAQTGTGKTAAFLLPLLQRLLSTTHDNHSINAMIIVPTRELALQISQTLEGIAYYTDISSIAVYGGGKGDLFAAERKALSTGADIVICTPGRMISHLNMGYVKLSALSYLVLDEADRMLDMGFLDDILKIIGHMPKKRQNLLFSATMPAGIRKLATTLLHEPVEVNIAINKPSDQIKQVAYWLYDAQKLPFVIHVLSSGDYNSVLIFCSSKLSVKRLYDELRRKNFAVGQIQSDLEQDEREQVLLNFKNKKLKILVATDILSRGIDIEDIELVVNYDVPNDGEDYIHRIGRTARAATTGSAYTLVNEKDQFRFRKIEQLLGKEVEKGAIPTELGAGPQVNSAPVATNKKKKKNNKFRKKPNT